MAMALGRWSSRRALGSALGGLLGRRSASRALSAPTALGRPPAAPRQALRRLTSTSSSANATTVGNKVAQQDEEGDVVVDIRGDEWVLKRNPENAGEFFWYNRSTWETRNDRPPTAADGGGSGDTRPEGVEKPQYATDWYDARFPEVVQYIEFQSKRVYYHNSATNEVSWAPPDDPERDVFQEEINALLRGLTSVPDDAPGGKLWKRLAAVGVDFAAALGSACAFGGMVYVDLGDVGAAQTCIAISTWLLFTGRDMIIEQGTRSPGKKLLGLEIVRVDGQLPSRWNNMFRNLYTPVYTAAGTAMPAVFAFSAIELGLVLFTPRGQRLGDLIGRTRVIEELPDRAERLAEKDKRDREDDAKE